MPTVGYVALIGRPNAGKSTLLNALIGEKVSAVSVRPQTTQTTIMGIYTDTARDVQIIFLDTPGIHEIHTDHTGTTYKKNHINHLINAEAFAGLRKADVIVRIYDPTRPSGTEDARIDHALANLHTPILRIETKQDITKKPFAREDIDLRIDSIHHVGFDALIDAIVAHLPEGPLLYDEEYYTDQPMPLRISELIREALFAHLTEEIPYACHVEISDIDDTEKMLKIHAYINTESESQKTIVIGKGGATLQAVGTDARHELERIFGKKVWLALRVKVDKNWRKNEKKLREIFAK